MEYTSNNQIATLLFLNVLCPHPWRSWFCGLLILPYWLPSHSFCWDPDLVSTSGESEQRSLYSRSQMGSMKPSSLCHCIPLSDLNTLLSSFHEIHRCCPPISMEQSVRHDLLCYFWPYHNIWTEGSHQNLSWKPPLPSRSVVTRQSVAEERMSGLEVELYDLDWAPSLTNVMRCLELGGDSALLLRSTCCSTASFGLNALNDINGLNGKIQNSSEMKTLWLTNLCLLWLCQIFQNNWDNLWTFILTYPVSIVCC